VLPTHASLGRLGNPLRPWLLDAAKAAHQGGCDHQAPHKPTNGQQGLVTKPSRAPLNASKLPHINLYATVKVFGIFRASACTLGVTLLKQGFSS